METLKKLKWPIAAFVLAIIVFIVGDTQGIPIAEAVGGVGAVLSVGWAAMKWQNIELIKALKQNAKKK